MPRSVRVTAAVGVLGAATLVVGTFLPWTRSGHRERNSFRTGGVVRDLLAPGGAFGAAIRFWPLVLVLVGAAVAAALLGMRRTSGVLALLSVTYAVTMSLVALGRQATTYASVVAIGPVITCAGAAVLGVAALCAVLARAGGTATTDRTRPPGPGEGERR